MSFVSDFPGPCRRKGGRPRLPDGERMEHLGFGLRPAERAWLDATAQANGRSRNQTLRDCLRECMALVGLDGPEVLLP